MKTKLTTLLNIEYPIVQAPIGSATNPVLASEVSNAGGLGMLALSWKNLAFCKEMIRKTKTLTEKPFGVNLVLAFDQEERVAMCIAEKVPVVSFFWGDSTKFIEPLQANGIKICQTVASSKEAAKYADLGVDLLIAQGWEAGGHVQGTVANSVLIPAIADQVNIPIVAAGGFSTGNGLLAALALGSDGISMGTRFLMSNEASVEPDYTKLIAQASESDTAYVENLFNIGWDNAPHRVLRNSTVIKWEESGKPIKGQRPNEDEIIAKDAHGKPIQRYSDNNPILGTTGNLEALALYAGQSAGLMKNRIPAKEIIKEIMDEVQARLNFLNQLGSI